MKMKKAICLLLSLIIVSGILPVISYAQADIETGLIAYYSFEEDSNNPVMIKDMSGKGNNATVLNTVNTNSGVKNILTVSGGVATFPGMTSTDSGTWKGAALKLSNDFNQQADSFTYSAWIYADSSYIYANRLARFFDFANMGNAGTDKTNSIFARYTTSNGLLYIRDRKLNNVYQEIMLSDKPFTDSWGLFTFVYSKNNDTGFYETDVYVNGTIVPSLSTTNKYTRGLKDLGELTDISNGMFIGRTTWCQVDTSITDPDFKGQMDEIRIYNRALTAEDINYLYINTSPLGKITMESFEVDDVHTIAGNYPILPTTVVVKYTSGLQAAENVTWDMISSDELSEAGTITVNGTTDKNNKVSINVIIYQKDTSPLSIGLVAYYNFDTDTAEPDVVIDTSGNGNNASVYNLDKTINGVNVSKKLSVADGIAYFPGSSLSEEYGISGDHYFVGPSIRMPNQINQGIDEFTYAAWIYADTNYRYSGGLQRFFDLGSSERNSFFYRYVPQTGDSRFQDRGLPGSSANSSSSLVSATLTDKPFNDQWAHLAVTYKKGNNGYYVPTVYINGQQRYEYDTSLTQMTRSFADAGTPNNQIYGFWIGRTQWSSSIYDQRDNPDFKGMMDEIRLYNRVLTENEVWELFNRFKPGNITENGNDTPITVTRTDRSGNVISTSTVYGGMGKSYTYPLTDAIIIYNDTVYAVQEELSNLTIDNITGEDTIVIVYDKADNVVYPDVNVKTYLKKVPSLPGIIELQSGIYSSKFPVQWDDIDTNALNKTGTFEVNGTILNSDITVSAQVMVFPNYNNSVGGDLTITFYKDGIENETIRINNPYGATFTLSESYKTYFGDMYVFDRAEGSISTIGESLVMDELGQHINLYYTITENVFGSLNVRIKADDLEATSYSLIAEASVLNTEKTDKTVKLIIAFPTDTGITKEIISESTVVPARTGQSVPISKKLPFDKEKMENGSVYLWTDSLEPITQKIKISDVETEGYLTDEVEAMMPSYDRSVDILKRVNTYWQNHTAYNQGSGGHASFWDTAAYHTGNMEYFKLTGDSSFLQYSVNWANNNEWMGNTYEGDPDTWTWNYNGTRNSTAVLFGDWQTCFQTYIDLYNFNEQGLFDIPDANLDRVMYVMDYQVSTDRDNYWWWADGLYMVMPVLSKLYARTQNEKYLDALTEYFVYAKELMYDGPGGIPTSIDGYTTSAALKSGAQYSNPDDYNYLFYRDANYVYPLSQINGGKNFWARGNGWVFAALAKVLSDMPEDYRHYDVFFNTFKEMANAIISCQETDDNGYGFWTQSMTQDYPKGSNGNDEGYETSGTAFMTYGLFWGINNGLLDQETYLEPTLRAWGYLENIARSDSGKIGYVQPIGSAATTPTGQSTTQNFGVGAFLLAGCEAAKWAVKQ